MIFIPSGEFIMGSDRVDTEGQSAEFGSMKPWFADEHPQRKVNLATFYIDRHEVTNANFAEFVRGTQSTLGGPAPPFWQDGRPPPGQELLPVTQITWSEANAFCKWAGKRLPTEAEWEKAARGTDGREYVWGNDYKSGLANTGDAPNKKLMQVGSYPMSKSPYGVEDMVGNVWEWTSDWYQTYPGSDYRSDAFGVKFKVIRGNSWGELGHYTLTHYSRAAYRFYAPPEFRLSDVGLRCAK
ncbi:MAG TPA: formylglycine-generating enzyme family protein [Nitrospiria bacterium]|nr:formylglycine-generating enzyme family protein [Nitrospiria bacterium]